MAIEIEKKYKLTVEQSKSIFSALRELGADYRGEAFETNTLYGGGILKADDAVLRVRIAGEKTILTYKRRIENDSTIRRQIEHETRVENALEMTEIIEALGFVKTLVYEKRRRTWKFRRVEVVLDELPFGLFMEIEGATGDIKEAEKILNAGNFAVEAHTYPDLTFKHGVKTDEGIFEARFI